jgi:hypothetical protein
MPRSSIRIKESPSADAARVASHVIPVEDAEDELEEFQVVKLAHGDPDTAQDVTAAAPLPTADFSTPLIVLSRASETVADEAVQLAPAEPGRVKIEVQNVAAVDGGRLLLGIGRVPTTVAFDKVIAPGQEWFEWTAVAVHAVSETGAPVDAAAVSWTA